MRDEGRKGAEENDRFQSRIIIMNLMFESKNAKIACSKNIEEDLQATFPSSFLPVIASDNRKKLHSGSLHGIHKFFMSFFSFIISHHQQKKQRPVCDGTAQKKTQQSLLTVKIFVHINCSNCWVNFSATNERLRMGKKLWFIEMKWCVDDERREKDDN